MRTTKEQRALWHSSYVVGGPRNNFEKLPSVDDAFNLLLDLEDAERKRDESSDKYLHALEVVDSEQFKNVDLRTKLTSAIEALEECYINEHDMAANSECPRGTYLRNIEDYDEQACPCRCGMDERNAMLDEVLVKVRP